MASSRAIFGLRSLSGPAFLFNLPFKSIICKNPRLWFLPISKSTASWFGVTFNAPVPNSISTLSSAITGICFLVIGSITFLPIQEENLLSFGLTATAKSPGIVSGRVVTTVKNSSLSTSLYFM